MGGLFSALPRPKVELTYYQGFMPSNLLDGLWVFMSLCLCMNRTVILIRQSMRSTGAYFYARSTGEVRFDPEVVLAISDGRLLYSPIEKH